MDFETNWPETLTHLLSNEELSMSGAEWAMNQIITGQATSAQIGAFLTALAAKGVTVREIVGFRDAILSTALPVDLPNDSVDIVGTGGDKLGTINVSTMASIIAAAAGAPVVKHGNRAVSSKSGASDVLSELGINVDMDGEELGKVFDKTNLSFVWAAKFLPGFKYVSKERSELGIPTVFNFLGPLCNPVRPEATAVGVSDARQAPLLAGVFQVRGAAGLVFRGDDGLDELTTTGHSHIWEVCRGSITEHDVDPRDVGLPLAKMSDIAGGTPAENADVIWRVMRGEKGAARDISVLNAAAGLVAYELHKNPSSVDEAMHDRLRNKLKIAEAAIDSGQALKKLEDWVAATQK